MYIVHVFIHVTSESLEAFEAATLANVRNSLQEPGIARFDFMQQLDDPCRFMLVEVYRTPEDAGKHKETQHYRTWRDTVAPMMAEPRSNIKFTNISPDDSKWDTPEQ
jgi:quinol monooxygenase YgiN